MKKQQSESFWALVSDCIDSICSEERYFKEYLYGKCDMDFKEYESLVSACSCAALHSVGDITKTTVDRAFAKFYSILLKDLNLSKSDKMSFNEKMHNIIYTAFVSYANGVKSKYDKIMLNSKHGRIKAIKDKKSSNGSEKAAEFDGTLPIHGRSVR
jgi:hypothetical protein